MHKSEHFIFVHIAMTDYNMKCSDSLDVGDNIVGVKPVSSRRLSLDSR